MKAISVKQPWAWLIVRGNKDIENRIWKTKFRGEFLVQASMAFDNQGYEWLLQNARSLGIDPRCIPFAGNFERGAIIGKATITDCVTESDSPWFFGPVGFVLEKAEAFQRPIPCKGKLGFFEVEL